MGRKRERLLHFVADLWVALEGESRRSARLEAVSDSVRRRRVLQIMRKCVETGANSTTGLEDCGLSKELVFRQRGLYLR